MQKVIIGILFATIFLMNIGYSVNVNVELNKGWNLVSSISEFENMNLKIHVPENTINNAGFIYSEKPQTISYEKECLTDKKYNFKLSKGWNLVPAFCQSLDIKELDNKYINKIYTYDNIKNSYVTVDEIEPGYSYWFLVNDDIEITYTYEPYCGDWTCNNDENVSNCPEDCSEHYGWPQYKANNNRTTKTQNYGPMNNKIYWTVSLNPNLRYVSTPLINSDEDKIILSEYYDDYENNVTAYSTINGEKLWSTNIGCYTFIPGDFKVTTPAVHSKYTYASSDEGFYMLDNDGEIIFSENSVSYSRPHVLLIKNHSEYGPAQVYYSINNEIVSIEAISFTERWRAEILNDELDIEEPLEITQLAGDDKRIYLTARHNTTLNDNKRWVYALNKTNGELLWKNNFPIRHEGDTITNMFDIILDDKSIILSDLTPSIIAYNKNDGSYRWNNIFLGASPYPLFSRATLINGRISLLDNKYYIGKSLFDGHAGIFTEYDHDIKYGIDYADVKPIEDVPTDLEEYTKQNIIISDLSNQTIIIFMSTRDYEIDGEWVGDANFNALYSYNTNYLLEGGEIIDWNWKTKPYRTIDGLTGNPAMDSKHVYITTRYHRSSPIKLISIGQKKEISIGDISIDYLEIID